MRDEYLLVILLLLSLIYYIRYTRETREKDVVYNTSTIPGSNTVPTFIKSLLNEDISPFRANSTSSPTNVDTHYADRSIEWLDLTIPLDQGTDCGSCWSFSAAGMFTDRLRIRYGFQDVISPFSLAACCACPYNLPKGLECTQVCGGNYLDIVTEHLVNVGASVEHSDRYVCDVYATRYKAKRSYKINKWDPFDLMDCSQEVKFSRNRENEMLILEELERNGPVCGIMRICVDKDHNFYNYKSGIYGSDEWICIKHDNFHAIIIEGSGIENGIKYWLCKNSWGTDWGEKGRFRILRGRNYEFIECDIWAVEV